MECQNAGQQGARGEAMQGVEVGGVDDTLRDAGRGGEGAGEEGLGRVKVWTCESEEVCCERDPRGEGVLCM